MLASAREVTLTQVFDRRGYRGLALVIGVDDYERLPPAGHRLGTDLAHAVDDAVELARHLVDDQGFASEDVVLCLSCAPGDRRAEALGALPATRAGIARGLAAIARRARENVRSAVVVAFHGHGATDEGGRQVLCPADTERGLCGALALRELYTWGEELDVAVMWVIGAAFGGPVSEGTRTVTPSVPAREIELPPPHRQEVAAGIGNEWRGKDRSWVREHGTAAGARRRWPQPGRQIDPEHTGFRVFDLRVPGLPQRVGTLGITAATETAPAIDRWGWDLRFTTPWPDLFWIVQSPQSGGANELIEEYGAKSFANAAIMDGATAPDPNQGKLWQLTASRLGVSQAMDAHLWRWQPFGQAPVQRWYARPPFTTNDYLPVDAQTTVWFTRTLAPIPAAPDRRVIELSTLLAV